MSVLNKIEYPKDIRNKSISELQVLAGEIREKILEITSENGGHLASNLGVVELTIALHYAFKTPRDKIVWDVSHQCYTHKILTGRKESIKALRLVNGCCGFTSRNESVYDIFGAGHAGTAVSAALGLAVARDKFKKKHKIVAVLGDGSLTNGISLEGLNNVTNTTKDLVIILNDNKMSISENVGGLTRHLNNLIQKRGYNRFRNYVKNRIARIPEIGNRLVKWVDRIEEGIKSMFVPGAFFEELGIRYIGPIDGHNIANMIQTFSLIKEFDTPVVVHVITEKGRGFKPAELSPERFHGLGKFDPGTGEVIKEDNSSLTFSDAFGEAVINLGTKHKDVVAITAAMCSGTGLKRFAEKFPDRFFDVGIAEEHAVVFSAGMAADGLRPVFTVYATFLQRALSSVYHDICIQKLPVIICTDRTGIVDDGPTHHGIYDLSYLRVLPNISIIYPSTKEEMNLFLELAYESKSPVIIRYPKTSINGSYEFHQEKYAWGKSLCLKEGTDVSIWAMGAEYQTAFKVAQLLEKEKISIEIINPLFIIPFDSDKLRQIAPAKLIVSIEDNTVVGGLSSIIDEILINTEHKKVLHFGWGSEVIPHGTVKGIKKSFGFTPENIAFEINKFLHTGKI